MAEGTRMLGGPIRSRSMWRQHGRNYIMTRLVVKKRMEKAFALQWA